MNQVMVNVNDLLKTKVADYVPTSFYGGTGMFRRRRPIFTQFTIKEMLLDPRITFGLWLIKGPILSKAKVKVECENDETRDFVIDAINMFWSNGAVQALKAIEWGYSGSEVLYKLEDKTGRVIYNGLRDFEPPSVRIVSKDGERVGIMIDNFQSTQMRPSKAVYLGGPKAFHHVHWRHMHPYYGRSRLIGVHIPWNEMWSEGGYRDIRRLWFYKNAFEGGTIWHPTGYSKTPEGILKPNKEIALEIVEKKRAGGVMALPSGTDSKGNKLWDYTPAQGNTIPAGLFEYGESLRIEMLEAMGIPYEVIEASGNEGFGSSSGREIPETAFYSILQEEFNWLIFDFVEQVVKPLVQINAHLRLLPYEPFKVLPHALNASPEDMEFDQESEGNNETQVKDRPDTGNKPGDKKPESKEDGEEKFDKQLNVAS